MELAVQQRLWRRNIQMWLLLLLPCFFLNNPAFATLEQGVALQEVLKSGWITTNRLSWTAGTDPCVSIWEGIDCDTGGNVITLNLTHVGLNGPVPKALGRLTTLTRLDMGNNKICTNCTAWNKVTGDLTPIANLVNLQFLCLTSNEMGLPRGPFPTAIYQLKQLVDLRVDNTLIGGEFPVRISTLSNLQYLYLGNNTFTGIIPRNVWGSLTNLKELSIWGNRLTGLVPPELGNLVNLTYLNLNKNSLYGGLPPELGKLIHLQRLLLYKNQFTGPLPDAWRGMISMESFQLNANYMFGTLPQWLLQLPKLSFLSLSNNQLRGSILPVLNNSTTPGLKTVQLECNYFEGIRPKVESNIMAFLEYNCFENETALDSACIRALNCQNFLLYTSNGKCPSCPSGQAMVNTTTCICNGVPEHSSKKLGIAAIIGIVVGVVVLLVLVLILFLWRARIKAKRKQQELPLHHDYFQTEKEARWTGSLAKMGSMSWEVPGGVQHFTMEELMKATKGFDKANEIGEGGFGKVFLGKFPGGRTLAIKRASPAQYSSESGHGQFRNEVLLLSRLHHKNLVRLEGFCDEGNQQILVYEYMKLGNLHSHLHGSRQGKYRILDWYKRLEIALNVAQGLEYLHSFADPPVIHRDVKPSNILLDDHLVAKVADFGISKESPEIDTHVSTRPAGTAGYFDPQYFLRRQLTTASDVYSFGVVLLELVSGRKAIMFDCPEEEEANIIEWAKAKMEPSGGGIDVIVDPKLEGNYPRELFVSLVDLGLRCSSFKRNVRPTMKAVVGILEPLFQEAERPTQNSLLQLQLSLPSSSMTNSTEGATSTGGVATNSTAGDMGSNEGTITLNNSMSSTRIEMDTVLFPR
ncbi:hypothetical protein M758_11G144600 [Ceratodon purpureus]|nr:hypothetical protein M758_11G144600 [Ceratodon purpureus]